MSDPRYDPAFQRGYREPEPTPTAPESQDATRSRNPWLTLLWVLAVVLMLGGIAALLTVGALELAPPSDPFTFYVLTDLLAGVGPGLVGAGVGGFVGAVFIHALDWRRRRARGHIDPDPA
jgi:hypothetical protein